mmetsp:Transcript_4474/g.9914  ORF Transcript_4474/g.9914 Transcript_4474/m.9914 type:complete len:259 (+) Transcript_4474:128-904(+)
MTTTFPQTLCTRTMKIAFLLFLSTPSTTAFAPALHSSTTGISIPLFAASDGSPEVTVSRRSVLEKSLAAGVAFLAKPQLVNAEAVARDSWASSIQESTQLLSQSLGHALSVIDGMNMQAKRLGTSSSPAHPIAVLDGMNAQARRLIVDLDNSIGVLNTIKSQAKYIANSEEELSDVVGSVSHAASVLDGLLSQSKRLIAASSTGGSSDEQIVHMLSVLDGLNAQARRINANETFNLLDELNAKAEKENVPFLNVLSSS